jgi:hypothetical protein
MYLGRDRTQRTAFCVCLLPSSRVRDAREIQMSNANDVSSSRIP